MISSNIEEQAWWRRAPGNLRLACDLREPPSKGCFCRLALLIFLMLCYLKQVVYNIANILSHLV